MASLFVCEILKRLENAKSESGSVDPTAQESSLLCAQMDSDGFRCDEVESAG